MSLSRAILRVAPRQPLPLRSVTPRLLNRQAVRLASTIPEVATAPAPKRSWILRLALFTGTAVVSAAIGFAMAVPYETVAEIRHPASDADTLQMFVPADTDAQEKEDYINSLPLVAELRANPDFIESRPHLKLPNSWREQNLTAGTLMGNGRVTVPPFSWSEKSGKSYVQISHVGPNMCGHMGVIHGGFLATMLDEGLARCCFPVLPHHVGMTAKLEVNYKAPAMADQYLVLRGTTVKSEGRKAWVEGHIETVPIKEGDKPVVLATASALYISPRQAAVRLPLSLAYGDLRFCASSLLT
ncbi:Thioesterase/thiol ester dehydrase-isomerase [Thozetella sp. PMI_491]|nr:Thioesterase/thiol ester dehydrase-isomerase [Thozetella sp. PMI_491]